MEIQHQIQQIRSLAPISTLCPIYSIQQKSWHKVYRYKCNSLFRAECMIPFSMYSIKIVYIITFIGFRIFVRVDLYIVPMVYPEAFPIEEDENSWQAPMIYGRSGQVPIASYSFNCIYCARCNLGLSCRSHVSGYA